jgi:hypothetical protein
LEREGVSGKLEILHAPSMIASLDLKTGQVVVALLQYNDDMGCECDAGFGCVLDAWFGGRGYMNGG